MTQTTNRVILQDIFGGSWFKLQREKEKTMYRVGFPGWKLAARFGIPLLIRVNVHQDNEANVFWADSPDLDGLTVEGATLEEVRREVAVASGELLSLQLTTPNPKALTELRIRDESFCAA